MFRQYTVKCGIKPLVKIVLVIVSLEILWYTDTTDHDLIFFTSTLKLLPLFSKLIFQVVTFRRSFSTDSAKSFGLNFCESASRTMIKKTGLGRKSWYGHFGQLWRMLLWFLLVNPGRKFNLIALQFVAD